MTRGRSSTLPRGVRSDVCSDEAIITKGWGAHRLPLFALLLDGCPVLLADSLAHVRTHTLRLIRAITALGVCKNGIQSSVSVRLSVREGGPESA